MDVVEFLRQRLDEEEVQAQLAQHCAPSPWKYVGGQKFANTAQILDGASASLGECEDCGDEIGIRRLEIRPVATLCVKCKELEEKREKAFDQPA